MAKTKRYIRYKKKKSQRAKTACKEKPAILKGTFRGTPNGYGFVVPANHSLKDIFIPRQSTLNTLDGDKVSVAVSKRKKISRERLLRGKIIQITERASPKIIGTLIREKNFYLIPDNPKLNFKISLPGIKEHKISPKTKAVAIITKYQKNNSAAQGKLIKILGTEDNPKIDTQVVMEKYNLPCQFPKKVTAETEKIKSVISSSEIKKRTDLRKTVTITIDPEDAQDFDDAVSLEKNKDGTWNLGIHIADVSHYIQTNSALDKEAFQRGVSVYLADEVIPLLPEKLSNGICSLKESQIRLTKSVIIQFSKKGEIQSYSLLKSVIKSHKRLNYQEVSDFLQGKDSVIKYSKIKKLLQNMKELALILKNNRIKRGCLYLNLPETKIVLNNKGLPETIKKEKNDTAHSIIEEFMLTANEVVASFLKQAKIPAIYRVHPQPDPSSLKEFHNFLKTVNIEETVKDSRTLQHILKLISNKPESYIVNLTLLQSLKQAYYSAHNIGHFALAAPNYTHFTSPIRRYADLVIHRLLDCLLNPQTSLAKEYETQETMEKISSQVTIMEKNAKEAEYTLIDKKKLRFLNKKENKDKIWQGIIISIHNYGFFVQIPEYLIEGLVHITNLKNDCFIFKETKLIGLKTKTSFTTGDPVKIKVCGLDINQTRIDFTVV